LRTFHDGENYEILFEGEIHLFNLTVAAAEASTATSRISEYCLWHMEESMLLVRRSQFKVEHLQL